MIFTLYQIRVRVAWALMVVGMLFVAPTGASADELADLDRALDGHASNPWAALADVRMVLVTAPDRASLAKLVGHIEARTAGDDDRATSAQAMKRAPELAAFFTAARPPQAKPKPKPPSRRARSRRRRPPKSCESKCDALPGAEKFRCRVKCKKDGQK